MAEEDGDVQGMSEDTGSFQIPKIHRKLKEYKFDSAAQVYKFFLERRAPNEATVISKPVSKSSLELLKCVSILFTWERKVNGKDIEVSIPLAKLLSRLSYGVQGGPRLERQARKNLVKIFKQLEFKELMSLTSRLLDVDKNMVCLSTLYNWLVTEYKGDGDPFSDKDGGKTRQSLVEVYVREVLMTKVPKTKWVAEKVAANLMTCFKGKSDCEEAILSAISKALLRSPETSVEPIGFTLKSLQIVLKKETISDLGKRLGACLNTENDKMKTQATLASQALFAGLSTSELRKIALNEYFELVSPTAKGTKSTLTSSSKIAVLQLISTLGSELQGKDNDLSEWVVEKCTRILETDVHEGTLLECMEVIGVWSTSVTAKCPSALSKYIQTGLNNAKANVRLGLCRMVSEICIGDRISSWLPPHVDGITKCIEKALAQPAVVNNLTEAISLSLVLVNANAAKVTTPELSNNLVKKTIDSIDEKFLSSCLPWVISQVALLIRQSILTTPAAIVPSKCASLLVNCLPYASYQTRPVIKEAIKTVYTSDHSKSTEVCERLLEGAKQLVSNQTVNVGLKVETIKLLSNAMAAVALNRSRTLRTTQERALLELANGFDSGDLWENCMRSYLKSTSTDQETDLGVYVEEHLVSDEYMSGDSDRNRRILKCLIKRSPKLLIKAMGRAVELLKNPEYSKISRDDYFVFRTPEGQLYNQSVVDAGSGDGGRNMKRESKVYSYQEQLEEIQLRRELDEKRKKAGKGPSYTPKQLEAIKTQLGKESAIRDQVRVLDKQINEAVSILEVVMESNFNQFGNHVAGVVSDTMIVVMKSPVAAPVLVEFFVKLGKTLFPGYFGEQLAQCCLRLIKPLCDLDKEWQQVNVSTLVSKVLAKLKEMGGKSHFSNAVMSYCYPFFSMITKEYPKSAEITTNTLQIINGFSTFINTHGDGNEETSETTHVYGPYSNGAYTPRAGYTQLLYSLLERSEGTTQQLAVNTLVAYFKTSNSRWCPISKDIGELKRHIEGGRSRVELSRDTFITCAGCLIGWNVTVDDNTSPEFFATIFREQYDPVSRIGDMAIKVWNEALDLEYSIENDKTYEVLSNDVLHPCEAVRVSAAKAIDALMGGNPDDRKKALDDLRKKYEEYEILLPPVVDSFGRVLEEAVDKWEGRCGVGMAVKELAKQMNTNEAKTHMEWIVTQTLGDRSHLVHAIMLETAMEIVRVHGDKCLNTFIDTIETFLEQADKSRRFDNVRQACVVLMGSLAKYLDPNDKRVKSIFDTLLETLSTPSEQVQEAVANCLPGLVPAVKDDAEAIVNKLSQKMMGSDNFGERRGAAYGFAGLIKGLGILSLKQHKIMEMLAKGMQDKKDFKRREGSLMALELLCQFLGRLFEPYIVHVLPDLLQCLGDSNAYVREATENTAKRVMSRLSGHGVKLVLPALLAALNEDSWRTKCGSVDLLGRMAYCAPRQLSGCLPMIVPKLIEVLGDSHVKVQDSSTKALGLIGSVIQNPEVASVVPVLLDALQDPGKKASSCLQSLLQTEFVHFVDPPSLALIMPVVQRAFQDRSTENRKMACQIIGNMYSLTDHSDLAPYMENVMPGIKTSLLDPVPEVRAVAAKALGAMAKGMGEKCYEELLPWLMKTLVSDVNSVDRSGAAQGLAEVIGALGEDNLHKFMPEIIRKADSEEIAPHVRDGYMMMFIYMPGVFEEAFVQYIGQIINPILKALADENEYVRETALRAGQRLVTGFAESAIMLLLPELEKGVFDDNWRIRYSSVQLLGDLLYKISGVSGKMSTESANDDDNFGTEQSQKLIIAALGLERRNRVLAGLYMGRSDVALMVRQASLHVWKVIVANTPKTLREILPTLFSLLLGCLAAASNDKRTVAARTLGDLVRKLGEKILPEIIPILEKGLESQRSDERQGVCIGLCEIMANTSKEMILAFVDNLVPTLRRALCDPQPEVRKAAALTFGSLHSNVGSRAMEEIVPFLMKKLSEGDQTEADQALDGLGQILIVKSKSVMPYLIPQLTAKPPNTRAMAILASVANDAMSKHLGKILPCLLEVLIDNFESPNEAQELENCNRIILTVTEETAVRTLIDELLDNSKSENPKMKRAAVTLLSVYCVNSNADLTTYVAQLLRGLIMLMTETDDVVLNLVADGVAAIVKGLDSAERLGYVSDLKQAILFAKSDLKGKEFLPGVCIPKKGINPMLPIYREAVLNGSTEMKELATVGMGELITMSTEEALKPSVINVTGPLIRILGDRYGPSLKCAVLDTLTLLLFKVGPHLKAFLPQLQTTFLKSSVDQNRNVRLKAAVGLAQLLPIHNKPDPMFQDLLNSLKSNDEVAHRDTLLYTLRCTAATGGHKISEATKKSVLNALWTYIGSADESTNTVTAGAIGVLLQHLPEPEFEATLNTLLTDEIDTSIRNAKASALVVGLKVCPQLIYKDKFQDKVCKSILDVLSHEKVALVSNGIRAICYLLIHCVKSGVSIPAQLVTPFSKTINNSSNEVKTLLGQVSEVIGRQVAPAVLPKEVGKYLIPALVNGTKEKNSIVRASCETALVCILRLREGDNAMNTCLEYLDSGAREALNDVISKVLRKTLKEPESKEPDVDDTILS